MSSFVGAPLGRRRLLGAGGALAAGAASLIAVGCGDDDVEESAEGTPVTAVGAGATPTPGAATPRRGGMLRAAQVTDIVLNTGFPYVFLRHNGFPGYAGMESLVRYRKDLTPELVLADRFEYNPDRTALTVTLKQGVTFHDGSPVTPEDVFHGIDVILDPKKFNITGAFQLATFAKFITGRKKVDERTMEFTFDKQRVNMTDFFAQLSITKAGTYADLMTGKNVQGTGPYMFKSWTPGQLFRMERNPNWHGTTKEGGPYLDAIEVKLFADLDAMGLAFESGEAELILGLSANIAKRFRDRKLTRLAPKVGLSYIGANITNPLVKDKRVRRALFYAIDRSRFAEEIDEGFYGVTVQPWPEGSPAFDPALEKPYYDPGKARDLLKQAGFSQDKPLKIEYSGTSWKTHAPVWQENFEAIGVRVELAPLEGSAFTAKLTQRKFTDLFVSTHAYCDLSPLTNFQQTFPYRIPNISYFEDPGYLQLIADLEKVDPNSTEAKSLYANFSELWLDQAWLLPFAPAVRIDVVGEKVMGFDEYFLTLSQSPNFGKIWKTA